MLVRFALENAGDNVDRGWQIALEFVNGLRRWCFLPAIVGIIPSIIVLKGGDALSVCFNTVAILFTLEIDNLAFKLLLSERTRAYIEEVGHVELTMAQRDTLTHTKLTHATLITASVLIALQQVNFGVNAEWGTGVLMFILAGIVEKLVAPGSLKDKLLGAASMVVAGSLGFWVQFMTITPW